MDAQEPKIVVTRSVKVRHVFSDHHHQHAGDQPAEDDLVCCSCLMPRPGLMLGECACLLCGLCWILQGRAKYCRNCNINVNYIEMKKFGDFPSKGKLEEIFSSKQSIGNMILSCSKAAEKRGKVQLSTLKILDKQETAWKNKISLERKESQKRRKEIDELEERIASKTSAINALEEGISRLRVSEMSEPSRQEFSAETGSVLRPLGTREPENMPRQILPSFQSRQPGSKSRTQVSSHNDRFAPVEDNVKVSNDREVPHMKRKERHVFVPKTGLVSDLKNRQELLLETGSTVGPLETSEPGKRRRQIPPSFQSRQSVSRTQVSSNNGRFAAVEDNVPVQDNEVPDIKRKETNVFVPNTDLVSDFKRSGHSLRVTKQDILILGSHVKPIRTTQKALVPFRSQSSPLNDIDQRLRSPTKQMQLSSDGNHMGSEGQIRQAEKNMNSTSKSRSMLLHKTGLYNSTLPGFQDISTPSPVQSLSLSLRSGTDIEKVGFSLPRGEATVIGNSSFNQSSKNTHHFVSLVGSDAVLNNSNDLGEDKENSYVAQNSQPFTAQQVYRPKKRWTLASKARKGPVDGEHPY